MFRKVKKNTKNQPTWDVEEDNSTAEGPIIKSTL